MTAEEQLQELGLLSKPVPHADPPPGTSARTSYVQPDFADKVGKAHIAARVAAAMAAIQGRSAIGCATQDQSRLYAKLDTPLTYVIGFPEPLAERLKRNELRSVGDVLKTVIARNEGGTLSIAQIDIELCRILGTTDEGPVSALFRFVSSLSWERPVLQEKRTSSRIIYVKNVPQAVAGRLSAMGIHTVKELIQNMEEREPGASAGMMDLPLTRTLAALGLDASQCRAAVPAILAWIGGES